MTPGAGKKVHIATAIALDKSFLVGDSENENVAIEGHSRQRRSQENDEKFRQETAAARHEQGQRSRIQSVAGNSASS